MAKSSSDVVYEPVECSCDVGFWEWPLDTVVEAVSKKILCAWGRLGVGAEVVEPNVLYGLNVLCKGHVGVSGPVVQPTDGTHACFIMNGYLWIKHGCGQCNGIEMILQGLLNKSSLFRFFILYIV